MENLKVDKKIDELDLYRSMRETQARMGLLAPGAARLERINSIVLQLRNLPEADFENALSFIEALLQKTNKAQIKKASQAKTTAETSRALGDVLHSQKSKTA